MDSAWREFMRRGENAIQLRSDRSLLMSATDPKAERQSLVCCLESLLQHCNPQFEAHLHTLSY